MDRLTKAKDDAIATRLQLTTHCTNLKTKIVERQQELKEAQKVVTSLQDDIAKAHADGAQLSEILRECYQQVESERYELEKLLASRAQLAGNISSTEEQLAVRRHYVFNKSLQLQASMEDATRKKYLRVTQCVFVKFVYLLDRETAQSVIHSLQTALPRAFDSLLTM